MELKAAWRVLTDPAQSSRYLTGQAVLVNNGVCSTATVGLVGLHIIHKTVTQPQWIWATFEHVDNVPPASPATFTNRYLPVPDPDSQLVFQDAAGHARLSELPELPKPGASRAPRMRPRLTTPSAAGCAAVSNSGLAPAVRSRMIAPTPS